MISDAVSNDVPDLYISSRTINHGGWFEVKYLRTVMKDTKIPFRTGKYFTRGQQRWLEDMGGQLIIGAPDGHWLIPTRFLRYTRTEPWGYVKKCAVIWASTLDDFARELEILIK